MLTHDIMIVRRDRSIISALIAGEHPSTVADRFGITRGRVSQLRHRYEQQWRTFQGEMPGNAEGRQTAAICCTGSWRSIWPSA